MIRSKTLGSVLGAAAVLVSTACGDLEVTNPNNPDVERTLATPADVQALALGAWSSYWWTHTFYEGPMMMAVTADVLTANFGNFGMRFNNMEPRIPYDNNSAGGDRAVTEEQWDGYYAAMGAANDALWAMKHKEIEMSSANAQGTVDIAARMARAASLTQLAILFDQAFIVDEDSVQALQEDPTGFDISLHPYDVVGSVARGYWDEIISLTENATWSVPAAMGTQIMGLHESTGEVVDTDYINRYANTMAARLLAYMPRTAAQTEQVDWNAVLDYAQNGLTDINGDGPGLVMVYGPEWASYINLYGNLHSWLRVDHRIINMMDPSFPAKFDGSDASRAMANPDDARYGALGSGADIQFRDGVIGDPLRGIWMQSTHYHARWENISFNVSTAIRNGNPIPFILPAENNLLIAEALIRTGGDLGAAADLINITRVGRGELAPATAADGADQLLDYILYERYIELMNTSAIELMDARRFDDVQEGTLRHLPLPAKELETLGLPIYTFGGVDGPVMRNGRPAYTPSFIGRTPRLERPIF